MGDVADILGFSNKKNQNEEALRFFDDKPKSAFKKAVIKPKGMSREVYKLQGWNTMLPAVGATSLPAGYKEKRQAAAKGKWVWEAFLNSARKDSQRFLHWTKAENVDSEYPWAKFDVHMETMQYSDLEYETFLQSNLWSRNETDYLMEISYQFDLRWSIIYDRYAFKGSERRLEDLQHRFLDVISKLKSARASEGILSLKTEPVVSINIDYERNRRMLQETYFAKFKEEDMSLSKIKEEIKTLNAASKKNKRPSKATASKADSLDKSSSAVAAAASSDGTVPPEVIAALPVEPLEGKPALQSTRLTIDARTNSPLSKTLFHKMHLLLKELGFPEAPIPTRAAIDLMDTVRRNTLGLLSLQTAIKAKQRKVEALRQQLGDLIPNPTRVDIPTDSFVPVVAEEVPNVEHEVANLNNTKRKAVANPKKKKRAGGFGEGGVPGPKKIKQEPGIAATTATAAQGGIGASGFIV